MPIHEATPNIPLSARGTKLVEGPNLGSQHLGAAHVTVEIRYHRCTIISNHSRTQLPFGRSIRTGGGCVGAWIQIS